ncbi:protein trichome birefringence-like 18 [Gossypium hirsutum]|uniref:Protein trichome birefringence-like 18 n=1 Tax=Gossypium hirsutum TaxID=3635 RepID=A0A1U8KVA5_GOSHI|nr:protein trichome birefringence-like 18 [Gossypium hirsutum]
MHPNDFHQLNHSFHNCLFSNLSKSVLQDYNLAKLELSQGDFKTASENHSLVFKQEVPSAMGNSTIIERWWFVTFASFIVVLLLFLNHSPGNNNISVLQNLTMPIEAFNGFPMHKQSPMPPSVPLSGLQNSKPALPCLQTANLPDLSDSVKQATTSFQQPSGLGDAKPSELSDKIEARTADSSLVSVLEAQNQEQPKDNDDEVPVTMEEGRKCNIFEGKWVYDPKESPLYDSAMCPFLSETTSCRRNGRPDKEYEKWRWEINECKIPR